MKKRNEIVLLLLLNLISFGCNSQDIKRIDFIFVDTEIETPFRIKCEEFEKFFKDDLDSVSIHDDGILSPEELQQLEDFGLINTNGMFSNLNSQFPIIENKKYFDFNTFKTKAAEIWNKEAPVQQRNNDSEAPYLRGREPES